MRDLVTRRMRALLPALVAAVLLVSACGTGTAAGPAQGGAAELLMGEVGTTDGATIDLASLQGQDVVLWFWAPW